MTNDRDILNLLAEAKPESPRPELRERVLAAAREARHRERRWWVRVGSAAAVWLVVVVAGSVMENRESARTAVLVDGREGSPARIEAEALARELGDVPGAETLAKRMLLASALPAPIDLSHGAFNINKE